VERFLQKIYTTSGSSLRPMRCGAVYYYQKEDEVLGGIAVARRM